MAPTTQGRTVLPVCVRDPAVVESPYQPAGDKRICFRFNGLRRLNADLRRRGSGLNVQPGRAHGALAALRAETQASTIVAGDQSKPIRQAARRVGSAAIDAHAGQ